MHWCDAIEVEFIGTDSYPRHRRGDHGQRCTYQELRLQADGCQFCANLADLIDCRVRLRSTDGLVSGSDEKLQLTEETPGETSLYVAIRSQGVRNWSFAEAYVSYRTILDVSVYVPGWERGFGIIIQRAGPGGRVPVTNKAETQYGPTKITFLPPGNWHKRKPGDPYPGFDLWENQPEQVVGSLESNFGCSRPLLVDFDRLKDWMTVCDHQHKKCQRQSSPEDFPSIRLIDTKNMCIVESDAEDRPQFATLSYVWGSIPFFQLTTDNLVQLKTPGSLKDATLPRTIDDSILICRRLDIKYLWVDSLCIIQDDDLDMISTIDKMDKIYHGSMLTIVAATGENAHSGIPGLHPGSRSKEQLPMELRGVQLIDSIDNSQWESLGQFVEPEWISHTPWARRAWTFQEAYLSRRVLFFTKEQVYWHCHEVLWSEDSMESIAAKDNMNAEGKPSSRSNDFSKLEYQNLAITFSSRSLTFESDIGRAYLGTQKQLEKKWGGHKFSWGLPHGAFGTFLLWEWPYLPGRRMRQGSHPIQQADGSIVNVPFPTWSWMAWTEGEQLLHLHGQEPGPHTPLFFVFDSASRLIMVRDLGSFEGRLKPLKNLLVDSDNQGTNDVFPVIVKKKDIISKQPLTASNKHAILAFYTEIARVKYDPSAGLEATSDFRKPSNVKVAREKYPFSILLGNKFYPINEEHQALFNENKDLEEIELVVVFAGDRRKPRNIWEGHNLYCWPVIKKGGVRIRASYMTTIIPFTLWKMLPRRTWELVVME